MKEIRDRQQGVGALSVTIIQFTPFAHTTSTHPTLTSQQLGPRLRGLRKRWTCRLLATALIKPSRLGENKSDSTLAISVTDLSLQPPARSSAFGSASATGTAFCQFPTIVRERVIGQDGSWRGPLESATTPTRPPCRQRGRRSVFVLKSCLLINLSDRAAGRVAWGVGGGGGEGRVGGRMSRGVACSMWCVARLFWEVLFREVGAVNYGALKTKSKQIDLIAGGRTGGQGWNSVIKSSCLFRCLFFSGRERARQRKRERETDRQIDRQTDRQRETEKETESQRETEKETERDH